MKKTHWAPSEMTRGIVAACRIFRDSSARSAPDGPSDPTSGRAAPGLVYVILVTAGGRSRSSDQPVVSAAMNSIRSLGTNRQSSRSLLGRSQGMFNADPQDRVVINRADRYQPPGTAINLLEPGPDQILIGICDSSYEMHIAIFQVVAKRLAQPASFVSTGFAVYYGNDGCRIADLGADRKSTRLNSSHTVIS